MAGKRSVGSILVNVGADTRGLTQGLAQARKQVGSFGNQVGKAARQSRSAFSGMGTSAGAMLGRMRALPMIGGALSVGGLAAGGGALARSIAQDSAQYSPGVMMMHERMKMLQMKSGRQWGKQAPTAAFLASGGIGCVVKETASRVGLTAAPMMKMGAQHIAAGVGVAGDMVGRGMLEKLPVGNDSGLDILLSAMQGVHQMIPEGVKDAGAAAGGLMSDVGDIFWGVLSELQGPQQNLKKAQGVNP